ncbi:trans-sialidase [Trypanosoma cruzi]|nr:trans-sialidase [Trypanosoma cruzi]
MAGNFVAASWLGEDPLPRVALWVIARLVCVVFVGSGLWPYPVGRGIELEAVALCLFSSSIVGGCWRCVRLLCGGPNLLIRGLTAPRWCVCVRAGVELPASARAVAVPFPTVVLFLPCVCAAFCFSPLTLFSCASAWSGRMLTGHVDRECVLTASIHFSPPVCLSFPVVCGVLHRVRAGPHTPTARRDLPCCCSFLCAMVLRAVPYRLSFSALCIGALLCSAPH